MKTKQESKEKKPRKKKKRKYKNKMCEHSNRYPAEFNNNNLIKITKF
jgi:hypothetical protein